MRGAQLWGETVRDTPGSRPRSLSLGQLQAPSHPPPTRLSRVPLYSQRPETGRAQCCPDGVQVTEMLRGEPWAGEPCRAGGAREEESPVCAQPVLEADGASLQTLGRLGMILW